MRTNGDKERKKSSVHLDEIDNDDNHDDLNYIIFLTRIQD